MWRTAGKALILVFFLPGGEALQLPALSIGVCKVADQLQGINFSSTGHYPNSESGNKSQSEDAASLEKALGLMWLGSP